MKAAKKFTRENPCTKVEIHNCFIDPDIGKYRSVPLVVAKMEIGDNVPKYLEKNDYLRAELKGGVDYYTLTADGEDWLREGLKRFLVLHPERAADVIQAATGRVIRRQAPTPTKAPAKAPSGVLRRRVR